MKEAVPKVKKTKEEIDMTEGPIFVNLWRYCIPMILSGFLSICYNITDMLILGNFVNEEALAAVGSGSGIVGVITGVFGGIGTGACVCTANAIGAKNNEKLSRYIHTSMALSYVGGLAAMLIGLLSISSILKAMNIPESLLPMSTLYYGLYFLGIPMQFIFNFASGLVRSSGDVKTPLYIGLFSGGLNVVLDLLFIAVFDWSVAGAAIGTAVSQLVAAVLIMIRITRPGSIVRYYLRKTRIYFAEAGEILRIGIPAGLQGSMGSFANTIMQSAINYFGAEVIAGNAAAIYIEAFLTSALANVSSASMTFTSQNYGAGKIDRIKKVLFNSLLVSFIIGVGCGGVILLLQRPILSLFNLTSEKAYAAGMTRGFVLLTTYFLCGVKDVIIGATRGLKYSLSASIVTLACAYLFRIFWLTVILPLNNTLVMVYISYPLSWILTIIAGGCCYLVAYGKVKKRANEKFRLKVLDI